MLLQCAKFRLDVLIIVVQKTLPELGASQVLIAALVPWQIFKVLLSQRHSDSQQRRLFIPWHTWHTWHTWHMRLFILNSVESKHCENKTNISWTMLDLQETSEEATVFRLQL